MADAVTLPADHKTGSRRFLTFWVAERFYALPAETVAEVIRAPAVAQVPQGPKSLLGVGNLRGAVLPVVSLRALLGLGEAATASGLAIVTSDASPVVLAVDAVQALMTVDAADVETDQAQLAAEAGEILLGAIRIDGGDAVARVLDIRSLLAQAFAARAKTERKAVTVGMARDARTDTTIERRMLVTFEIAGQEYAFDIDAVQEILTAPDILTVIPQTEAMVLGVAAHRETVLPLLSLRGLLGFDIATAASGREKVLVTSVGGVLVGLVADRARNVLAADVDLLEPVPAALAARAGGEAKITSIYRGEGGRRLISVLAPEQLFREEVMQRLSGSRVSGAVQTTSPDVACGEMAQFVVFRLGGDEFGLPVGAVDEVAHVPDKVTRLPNAPAFLEGVVNLRGEVLPVVDQRRRFDMPALEGDEGRRLIVVRTERHTAGLIVDSVSEVLRTTANQIGSAPDLTDDMSRLVQGVINLEDAGRIVLVLDPKELLSRAEQGLLDAFQASAEPAG